MIDIEERLLKAPSGYQFYTPERALECEYLMREAADVIRKLRSLIASTRLPECGCGRNPKTMSLLDELKTLKEEKGSGCNA